MRLVEDYRVRIGDPYRAQEIKVGADVGGPQPDRGIIFDLSRHENAVTGGQIGKRLCRLVVFAEPRGAKALYQVDGPFPGPVGQRLLHQDLEPAGPGRIIIDPQIIDHEAERRDKFCPKPA